MKKAEEIKARLRRFAVTVENFNAKSKSKVNKAQFVRLDMVLSAIDELEKSKTETEKK